MRLFAATIATETNTFSPLPTSLAAYKEGVFLAPGEHPAATPLMCTAPLWVARRRAAAEGFSLIEGSCFAASPAGTTNRADYEWMRDRILAECRAAMPLDGVLLGLHGAMVAHGYDDVEGDVIEKVREIVGPGCVIGVELDPHCHLTLKRVRLSDVVILYKEFPHTDVVERAEEVLDLVLAKIRGRARPVMAMYDCRQIGSYPTTLPLMRAFVDKVKAMEGKDGILSISIGHCFPYADVAELTGRILVIADGDKAKADAVATAIGEEFVAMRARLHDGGGGLRRGARAQRIARGGRRSRGQCRRRRAVRQHHHAADADRDAGRQRLPRPDLGPRRGPALLRCRRGRVLPAPLRRQDRPRLRPARRCDGDGRRAEARLLAELRPDAGAARRLRGDQGRWRRGGADQQPHPGAGPRAVPQPRDRAN
jgi:hypothetical protein